MHKRRASAFERALVSVAPGAEELAYVVHNRFTRLPSAAIEVTERRSADPREPKPPFSANLRAVSFVLTRSEQSICWMRHSKIFVTVCDNFA